MKSRSNLKRTLAAVVAGILIGGGVTTVTPAGAEVSQFAATNWKKIWKKKLQPLADKRYYTKAASNARYAAAGSAYSKAEVDAKLGGYYTKAQSDAAYASKTQSYTKAESDAKYAPAQPLYRGTFMMSAAPNAVASTTIGFGASFPVAPTVHYIPAGAALPGDCSGTVAAPNASPGHLCVFEYSSSLGAVNVIKHNLTSGAEVFGASMYAFAGAARGEGIGTWAARPSGPIANPSFAPAPSGARNSTPSGMAGVDVAGMG